MKSQFKRLANLFPHFTFFREASAKRASIRGWLIVFILSVSACSAKAQFAYLGTGLSYEFTPYRINYDAATTHHSFKWNVGGMWRPIRQLGVGVSLGIPVFQFTTFNFADSPTPDGSSFYNFKGSSSDSRARYVPHLYNYELEYGKSYTLMLRYFVFAEQGFYLDFRLTQLEITERFQVQRQSLSAGFFDPFYYGAVAAVNIDYENHTTMLIPGTALGFMTNLTERLKLDTYFGIDFLKFKSEPFTYRVAHDWDIVDDKTEYVDITGQTDGIKTILTFNLGLNYSF